MLAQELNPIDLDDHTECLQKALDAAGAAGGGHVRLTPGTYHTGTIRIHAHTTLEIMAGAKLQAIQNINAFPLFDSPYGRSANQRRAFIHITGAVGVTITGGGTIDGQGESFWQDPVTGSQWLRKIEGEVIEPMIFCQRCTDLRIDHVHLRNTPGWTLHLFECERVAVHGITMINHWYGPNNDGIDITGSHDVTISDCYLETSDDAICLKTFPGGKTCERVAVTNCHMRTNCVAVKIGTETWEPIRQFTISNCTVHNSTRAFGIYNHRGSVIEDVIISNVICDTDNEWMLNRPIQLELRQRDDTPIGRMRNILVKGMIARTDGRVLMTAQDGGMIENVVLEDVQIYRQGKLDDPEEFGRDAKSEQWPRFARGRTVRAAVIAENMTDLQIRGLRIDWAGCDAPAFKAIWCHNVQGGLIDSPLARGNISEAEAIAINDSTIRIRD